MTKIKTNFNEVTGATIVTGKGSQEKYAEGWEGVFGKKVVKCLECKDTRCVYNGPIGDPPEECEACGDQEP